MEYKLLMGNRILKNENEQSWSLNYYLTKNNLADCLWGVEIYKESNSSDGYSNENEVQSYFISESRVDVENIIYKLMENMVTPISLGEVLDDLC